MWDTNDNFYRIFDAQFLDGLDEVDELDRVDGHEGLDGLGS